MQTHYLCRDALANLSNKALLHEKDDEEIDLLKSVDNALRDMNDPIDNIAEKNNPNNYSVTIPSLDLRNHAQNRHTTLLNQFITYMKAHNAEFYNSLHVDYNNGEVGSWDKELIDKAGGDLKSSNPNLLYKTVKAIAASDKDCENLVFEPPEPMSMTKKVSIYHEKRARMNNEELDINGQVDLSLDRDMSEKDFLAILAHMVQQAEILQYKENSIKLRQETLLSLYRGNPNGEVKSLILETNALFMDLRTEQAEFSRTVGKFEDYAVAHGFSQSAQPMFDKIHKTMDNYTLLKDNNLSFLTRSEYMSNIAIKHEQSLYNEMNCSR